jgi:hypothetical protein
MSEQITEAPAKALGKKIGPLPGWAYVVIIAGAAYVVWYIKRRGVGVSTPVYAPVDNGSASPLSSSGGASPSSSYTGTVSTFGGAPAASTTNAQWARNTADAMIASGSNPADVNNAIANYLAGKQLDSTQASIIATALRTYGNPPEGVVPVSQAPAPAVTPLSSRFVKFLAFNDDDTLYGITPDGQQVGVTYAQWAALGFPKFERIPASSGVPNPKNNYLGHGAPASSGNIIYTVKTGDTLESIAQSFYGNSNGGAISAANPGIAISPGSVLKIPSGGK